MIHKLALDQWEYETAEPHKPNRLIISTVNERTVEIIEETFIIL
jgi:hypothetical protein